LRLRLSTLARGFKLLTAPPVFCVACKKALRRLQISY
jgi:hypothetical protein